MAANNPDNESQDNRKSGSSKGGTQQFSVRLEDEERERLEKCAEIYRRQTGSNSTASSLARTFIQLGLNAFERTGGLVVSQ